MVQQILAVFLVLGLLMAALWLLRRKGFATLNLAAGANLFAGKAALTKRMRVIERVVLTPQHSLHLVSLDNRLILFAASPSGCHAVDPTPFGPNDHDPSVPFRNSASC
jgi:hypothetical protein